MPSRLSGTELEAIRAIERGATQLRMRPRTRSRLLALGLISSRRNDVTVTDAGRRAGKHTRSPWI